MSVERKDGLKDVERFTPNRPISRGGSEGVRGCGRLASWLDAALRSDILAILRRISIFFVCNVL